MSELLEFTIYPVLGRKVDVPANDPSLFKEFGGRVATHDTGGLNFDLSRERHSCTKSYGYSAWSNSAPATPARCLGLFELDDGVNQDNLNFENGRVFYYDGSSDPQQLNNALLSYDAQTGNFTAGLTITGGTSGATAVIVEDADAGTSGTLSLQTVSGTFQDDETITDTDTGSATVDGTLQTTTFASDEGDLYSVISFGSYVIFADRMEHTPYKWKNGDQRLTKLITASGGTEYKFRYLIEWQRRIIGAYSNQTNGDIEIRWTEALPTWLDLEFAAANQIYKPTTDSISGISKLGASAVFLYGTDSISRLNYYGLTDTMFGLKLAVADQGTASHHSIVNAQGANWFFNKNYGFVRYLGGSTIVSQDIISGDIESDIASIDERYYSRIVGKYLPLTQQIVWALPLDGATTPSHLFYFHLPTRTWTKEDKECRYIDTWTRSAGEYKKPVFGNADGHVYQITGETLPSTDNLDGYRVEPILDFGNPRRMDMLSEIWFGVVEGGDYSIDVYYRSGDTVKELIASGWGSVIGTISLNNPSNPKIYINQTAKLHQIKWGTNLDSEKFGINSITFRYIPQAET